MEKKTSSSAKSASGESALAFCLGIVFVGCLMQLAGKAKGDSLVFPSVIEIAGAFFRLLRTARTYRLIFTSLSHVCVAMAVSTLVGVSLGMAEGLCPFVKKLLAPLMILLRSIPMIVLVVAVMALAAYSRVPHIATTLMLVPLISEAVAEGCVRIDGELIDVCRLNGPLSPRVLLWVHVPLMAGYLRQAYISAVGMAMKLVISAEYLVQTKNSLGKAVFSSGYFYEYEDVYAYALIMVLLIVLLTEAPLRLLRKRGGLPGA